MKKIIIIIILGFIQSIVTYAQSSKNDHSFCLHGSIDSIKEATVILSYIDLSNNRKSDTVDCESGTFSFSGTNFEPSWVFLKFTSNNIEYSSGLMLENGCQTIKMSKAGEIYEIIGNKLHIEYMKLLSNGFDKDKVIGFIKNNKESPLALLLLNSLIYQKRITIPHADLLFDSLTTDIKRSRMGRYLKREIQIRTVPRSAPDFLINDTLKVTDLKGKLVLLDFWASWCIPCREETPKLKQLFQEYKNELCIISISLDENKEKWLSAIKHDEMDDWINILRTDTIKKEYLNDTEHPIPMLILIDKTGKIIWNTIHSSERGELRFVIEKTLTKIKSKVN